LTARVIGDDLRELLGARVPGDHARQLAAEHMAARALEGLEAPAVLDVGCGTGRSVEIFRANAPKARWVGVDIDDSAEVQARTRDDAEFHTFNGVDLPFEDGRFDIAYCAQVLEHVQRPAPLLGEIARVLRPGGRLAGSTSQLEPFHSRSTFNYTPYGLSLLLDSAGFDEVELRPSIDALTLIVRRGLGGPAVFNRWWDRESPLNRVIGLYGRARGADAASVNAAKLLFCGQFAFLARRSPERGDPAS
jgi:SAM-dependent methyltransferase